MHIQSLTVRAKFSAGHFPARYGQSDQEHTHTTVYLDDILVTGLTEAEHLRNLDAVLQRLSDAGLRLNRNMCSLLVKEVDYLGYKLDAVGLHTQPENVRPILYAPAPTNVAQLQSFLGMINYYSRFITNCSTVNAPLYRPLRNDVPWAWTDNEARAFETAKRAIGSVEVFVHYDPKRPLTVNCDASQYGIGAVLAHKSDDGTDQPIAFASRSLSSTDKNYSKLDKEALAMVFGVCKFHQYLYGRDFEIYTDHKPLVHMLGAEKGVNSMCCRRYSTMQCRVGQQEKS